MNFQLNLYQKTALTTIVATIALILIGGLVRASGAGLGCPDWPKCFGMWIPPTTATDLPPEFDASLFNPVHTWTEYINRLVGVLIGFLITLTFIFSFKYRKTDRAVTVASGAAFVMVLFQGWLGGQVVRSGLREGMITLHMVVAMLILITLLYACFKAMNEQLALHTHTFAEKTKKTLLWLSGGLLFFTLIQLVLGTQVRESVDVAKNVLGIPRDGWLEMVGRIYEFHRSFSWVIVILTGMLLVYSKKKHVPDTLIKTGWVIAGMVLLQMGTGIGMEKLGMPGVLQVVHLGSVAVLVCAVFLFILMTGFSNTGRKLAS